MNPKANKRRRIQSSSGSMTNNTKTMTTTATSTSTTTTTTKPIKNNPSSSNNINKNKTGINVVPSKNNNENNNDSNQTETDIPSCVTVLQKLGQPLKLTEQALHQLASRLANAIVSDSNLSHHDLTSLNEIALKRPRSKQKQTIHVESPSHSVDSRGLQRAVQEVNKTAKAAHGVDVDGEDDDDDDGQLGMIEESVLDGGTALDYDDDDDEEDDDEDGDAAVADDDDDDDEANLLVGEVIIVDGEDTINLDEDEIQPVLKKKNRNIKMNGSTTATTAPAIRRPSKKAIISKKLISINNNKNDKNKKQQLQLHQQQHKNQNQRLHNSTKGSPTWWRVYRSRINVPDKPESQRVVLNGYVRSIIRACIHESWGKIGLRKSYDNDDTESIKNSAFKSVSASLALMERARHMGQCRMQFGSEIVQLLLNYNEIQWQLLPKYNTNTNATHNNDTITNNKRVSSSSSPNHGDGFSSMKISSSNNVNRKKRQIDQINDHHTQHNMNNDAKDNINNKNNENTLNSNYGNEGITDFIGCEICKEFRLANCRILLSGNSLNKDGRDFWPDPIKLEVLSKKREEHNWYSVTVEVDNKKQKQQHLQNDKKNNNKRYTSNDNATTCEKEMELFVDEQCLRKCLIFHKLVHVTYGIHESTYNIIEDELRDGVISVKINKENDDKTAIDEEEYDTEKEWTVVVESLKNMLADNIMEDEFIQKEVEQLQHIIRLGDVYFSGGDHDVMLDSGSGLSNVDHHLSNKIYDDPLYLGDERYERVVKHLLAQYRVIQH